MRTLHPKSYDYYEAQTPDYYAHQMEEHGMRARWFRQRQYMTRMLVKQYFRKGVVLDVGCGNCLWNDTQIPTIGVDICEAMLQFNKEKNPSFLPVKSDVLAGFPFKNESVDFVVITEFLEHVVNYQQVIGEIRRVLKKGGVVVCSVPEGGAPFVWKILFSARCAYIGWRYNDAYYKNRCGHKVDFTRAMMVSAFGDFKFIESRSLYFLTSFFVFRKD